MTATQIRLPEELDGKITAIVRELGISKNAAMLMLMGLGLKLYNANVSINIDSMGQSKGISEYIPQRPF